MNLLPKAFPSLTRKDRRLIKIARKRRSYSFRLRKAMARRCVERHALKGNADDQRRARNARKQERRA